MKRFPPRSRGSAIGYFVDGIKSALERLATWLARPRVKESSSGRPLSVAVSHDPYRLVPKARRETVRRGFSGLPLVETLKQDIIIYRYFGGGSGATNSRWFTSELFKNADEARALLALPDANTAQDVALFRVPAGTTILRGTAADKLDEPGFGEYARGGGEQIYILDLSHVELLDS